jgi:hypothetical protein
MLEQVLVDKLSQWKIEDGLIIKFLITAHNQVIAAAGFDGKSKIKEELCYLLVSYIGLVLTMPSMFPQPELYQKDPIFR